MYHYFLWLSDTPGPDIVQDSANLSCPNTAQMLTTLAHVYISFNER